MAESEPTAKSNSIHLSTFPEMNFVKHGLFAKFNSGFGPWEKLSTTLKNAPLYVFSVRVWRKVSRIHLLLSSNPPNFAERF